MHASKKSESTTVKRLKIPKGIRIRTSKKDRQHNEQKYEDTKGGIRIRTSKKDLQHNVQKFEDTKGS
jgi:uncharacterized protein involved in type VI secretion and phage assembly